VLGDNIRRGQRDPAEMLVDLLERGKDEFLGFLVVAIREMGEHFSHDIEINLTPEDFVVRMLCQITCLAGDDRRHLFQFQLPLSA
jgi:hypothetical protein